MLTKIIITLLIPLLCRCQQDQNPMKIEVTDCVPHQYYDITRLSCQNCPLNTVQNEHDPTTCRCKNGYRKKVDYGGLSLECELCVKSVPTADGWHCLPCDKVNDLATCGPCASDEMLYSRLVFGNREVQQKCEKCRSETQPLVNFLDELDRKQKPNKPPESCAPCRRFSIDEINCDCATSTAAGVRVGGVCFTDSKDLSAIRQLSDNYIISFGQKSTDQVDSALFKNHLKAAIILCNNKKNLTACNLLANMCVLLHFYSASSQSEPPTACDKYIELIKLPEMPQIFVADARAALQNTRLPTSFTFEKGHISSRLRLVAATYNVNGEFLGWKNLTGGLLQLCPAETKTLDQAYLFGQYFKQECAIPIGRLWTYKTQFYDIKLEFEDESETQQNRPTRLYDIPIQNRNYRNKRNQLVNLEQEIGIWQLTNRFFLVDNVAGIDEAAETSHGRAKIIQYARSLQLVITVQNTKNGHILSPYFVVDYGTVSATDDPKSEINVKFAVTYTGDTEKIDRHDKDLEITMGVLCSVGLLWSLLRAWSWSKRAGKLMIDLYAVFKALLYLAGILADVFFIVMFGTAAYICFAYKTQLTVVYVLLTENQEQGAIICVYVAFLLKTIELINNRVEQAVTETFFVDWERPRGHVIPATGEEAEHQPSVDDFNHRPTTPVTVWRTLLVANEWNELQNYRKTSPALQLILMTLFLKVFHFESLALAQPGWQLEQIPDYAMDTQFNRFALAAGLYLLIGFAQWTLNVLVFESLIDDHFRNFMDLCSISNISVLSLTRAQFGYYIHGRSVHGHADANMKEMNMQLQRERDNLTGHRGLEPNSDLQCFIVALPGTLRAKLDTIREPLRSSTVNSRDTNLDPTTARMNTVCQVHDHVNSLLMAFIEQRIPGASYNITDRSALSAMLDCEFDDTAQTGIFYRDTSDIAYSGAFVYGNEWTNLSFDALLFCVVDLIAGDYLVAVVVTFIIIELIRVITEKAFTNNLVKSSLVDDRFLI